MQKLFILALLGAFAVSSDAAAVVTVTAPAAVVTVTAGAIASKLQNAASHIQANVQAGATGTVASNIQATASSIASNIQSNVNQGQGSDQSSSSSSSSGSSGTPLVTESEFMAAWKAAIPVIDPATQQPTHDQYVAMVNNAGPAGSITSRQELAMFLAEIMWESGGLKYKAEISPPAGAYNDGIGDSTKQYYGRGYIQLSWGANYQKASIALNDKTILSDPDSVATDENKAWAVSFWYWKAIVKPMLASNPTAFGIATKAINGALECGSGPNVDRARKRFQVYTAILNTWEPSMTPVETGCYN